jgi:hypothetical protein
VKRRWGVVIGLAAVTQVLLARAAHAEAPFQLAQAAWPPPAGIPQPEPPIAGPRVILQVDNPNGRLQQHTQLRWRDICIAPCNVTLDPRGLYRIGGGTSLASDPFSLPRASGDVYIDAQVGSKVKHWVGLGLMIGGLVAAGYGLFFWEIFNSASGSDSASQDARNFGRNIGITFVSIGGVLEIVGMTMFFSSTSVQVR